MKNSILLTLLAAVVMFSSTARAQEAGNERAGATESEYGNIVVYLETAPWGQNKPFNNLCFTTSGAQAKTGCVPTAYAILMEYHKWPACAKEKKVYHSGTGESIEGNNYSCEESQYRCGDKKSGPYRYSWTSAINECQKGIAGP